MESKTIDQKTSDRIWMIKAFAVIAIVACHCTHTAENPGKINQIATSFFNIWIGYGVPIFYLLSGYVFSANSKFVDFLKKKAYTVLIPWIVTGTAVWLYVVLRKGGIGIREWFGYLFLRESYLYFLTDLVIFWLLFFFAMKKKTVFYVFIGYLFVAYLVGCMGFDVLQKPFLVIGVNYFHLMYFTVGTLLRRCLNTEHLDVRFIIGLPLFILLKVFSGKFSSLNIGILEGIYSYLMLFSLLVGLYAAAGLINGKVKEVIMLTGMYSFSVYLLHMPVAGVVSNLLNRSEAFAVLTFIRPLIVTGITMLFIILATKIIKKKEWLTFLIGLR